MKSVSNAYKSSMKGNFRSQSYVEIKMKLSSGDVIFNSNEVVNLTRTNDVDPISRRLPTETLDFSVLDFNGIYDFTSPNYVISENDLNAKVEMKFGYKISGSIEWMSRDVYYLSSKPVYENKIAKFSCVKKLSILDKTFYKGVFTDSSYTYKALAEIVLIDAGLTSYQYELDNILSQYNSSAPLPIDSHKNLLQMIAHATGCALYTDYNDKIIIKQVNFLSSPLDFGLTQRDVKSNSEKITKIASVQKCESYRYNYYETSSAQSTIYEESLTLNSLRDYHIEFPMSKNVSIKANGVEVSGEIYAQSADFRFNMVGDINIIAKGYEVKASKVLNSEIVSNDKTLQVCSIDNPIVTDYSVSAILAARTAYYLGFKNTTDFVYRGNPELDCLDMITYKNQFSENKKCLVLRNVINYKGFLSGELTLKFMD